MAVLMMGGIANAETDLAVWPTLGGLQFFGAQTAVGLDANIRVLCDEFDSVGNYAGSILRILDSNGRFVATGNPTIPASVGYSFWPNIYPGYYRAVAYPGRPPIL
jgi:hypothetical protein